MSPIVHRLEQKYADQVRFVFLDVDDPDTLTYRQNLPHFGTPSFILLDGDGNVLQNWVGLVSWTNFQDAIDAAIEG